MSLLLRICDKNAKIFNSKVFSIRSISQKAEEIVEADNEEFRVLNLRQVRNQQQKRRIFKKPDVLPPRFHQMPVDQDWGSVWPGPKTFHPAAVPLPVRQGYTPKGVAAPSKYGNAELMKIPNFLHLTPPVIKKQCEALKQFCTEWPKGLENEEKMNSHFPIVVITSDYCHGLPTIRNPLARIVTVKIDLKKLPLNEHAKDKFLRLVGERYNHETEILTLVTDRCPIRKQNYDYAMYLLTALFHESQVVEPWETTKSLVDMEIYDWNMHKSKKSTEAILSYRNNDQNAQVPKSFIRSVENLINEGENDYNLNKYKEEVLSLLELPQKPV